MALDPKYADFYPEGGAPSRGFQRYDFITPEMEEDREKFEDTLDAEKISKMKKKDLVALFGQNGVEFDSKAKVDELRELAIDVFLNEVDVEDEVEEEAEEEKDN